MKTKSQGCLLVFTHEITHLKAKSSQNF